MVDMKYHIWTAGCQMNVADSQRVAASLEKMGYQSTRHAEDADVIVLNTCVVRQSAENKAYGRLTSLRPQKEANPDLIINLMGCMVGVRGDQALRERFPYVDVFSPPSDPTPLVEHLSRNDGRNISLTETQSRFGMMDEELLLPLEERGRLVSAFVPAVYGCSHACSFCIIPYRRGVERSRPVGEIVAEIRNLAEQGVREVTLLGQIVDRYGKDIPDGPTLADLLRVIHDVENIQRIRFLTSHPNWMNEDLLKTVAELPKVCEHIEVPVQAGHDEVLRRMKRGYTADQYRSLIHRIREIVPEASIATDVIVGFPGETQEQFQSTYDLLEELRMDVAHLARYSPRPGTLSERKMEDDVPSEEKMRRFRALETLQEQIAGEINRRYIGETVEILVEEKHKDKWKGRTRTNKLVFFESEQQLRGQLVSIKIEWAGPWSMRGIPVHHNPSVDQARIAASTH
jgi:tRNA-2-methylthio-N6-dimethylallyladenosine synthase